MNEREIKEILKKMYTENSDLVFVCFVALSSIVVALMLIYLM